MLLNIQTKDDQKHDFLRRSKQFLNSVSPKEVKMNTQTGLMSDNPLATKTLDNRNDPKCNPYPIITHSIAKLVQDDEKVKCLFMPYYNSVSTRTVQELGVSMRKYNNIIKSPKLSDKSKSKVNMYF